MVFLCTRTRYAGFHATWSGGVMTDQPASAHDSDLPRLFYVGDIAVESTAGGSALLHRLLCEYQPEGRQVSSRNRPVASRREADSLSRRVGLPGPHALSPGLRRLAAPDRSGTISAADR